MYEVKLKEKLVDREFISVRDGDITVTLEDNAWNKCPDTFFKKNEVNPKYIFRKAENKEELSFPQNRQVRENLAMAQYKRSYRVSGETK